MGGLWILMACDGGTHDDVVEMVLQVERLEASVEVEFERAGEAGENFVGFWHAELRLLLQKDVSNTRSRGGKRDRKSAKIVGCSNRP